MRFSRMFYEGETSCMFCVWLLDCIDRWVNDALPYEGWCEDYLPTDDDEIAINEYEKDLKDRADTYNELLEEMEVDSL